MQIGTESRISHPQARVYQAYRDELPDIARYMPDIKEIIVHSRDVADGVVKLHNEWVSSTDLPRGLDRIIKKEHLRWDDHAEWHDDGHYVDWVLQTRVFTKAVDCRGRNFFEADGDHTRVRVTGELNIDLGEIPGVPRLLAGKLRPRIEKFIVKLISPNLNEVNRCLQRYLDENPG